ncbi:MAG: metallophosphoesterase [Eubacterium sp.]|nr:metallophosphoesterase [Eubacterium sp.]
MSKLDPRTKIVMLFSISGVAILVSNLWFLIGLLIFTILILVVGRVELSRQKKQFMGILSMLIFLFLLQAIFGQAYFGAVLCVRLIIVVMSALILLTGHMRDYLLALVQWKVPYELAYMVILAFHFFPILRQEALDVYHSIQLRGCELKKTSLKNKLLAFKGMCIPILAGALSRAQDTAIAMEARGFRMYRTRTYMRKLVLKKKDIFLMILFPVLAVVFVVGAYTFENNKTVIPQKQVTVTVMNNTRIAVSWTDDEKYDGIVRCGFDKYEAECVQIGDSEYYRYSAKIDDLKAGKKYKYTFGHGRDMSDEIVYVHDVAADEYSFLFMGDVQTQAGDIDYGAWGDYLKTAFAADEDMAFGLFAGNLVSDANNAQDWMNLFDNGEAVFVNKPMMTGMGEIEAADTVDVYCQMLTLPTNGKQKEEYYYFDYGDVFFLNLNTNLFTDAYKSQEDYEELVTEATEWLERMLKTNDRPWVIVNMYHPMYVTQSGEDSSDESANVLAKEICENWEALLAEYDVDLILSGGNDDICANTGTAIVNVSSSYGNGANYVKVDVTEETLTVIVYGENHQEVDRCEIK